ncbi:MAG: 6-carboxytetrahydropterin synthase [Elusimicrobia bacterium]|nr:6-carboxytetrahydropterin synthase [Elusimicrobiota bacterium]
MFRIVSQIHFCYGHRLMNYEGKCRHPHGHNGRAEVELSAQKLDRRGMVMDFGEIKTHLQSWIDQNLDHQMILRKDDPLVKILKGLGEPFYLLSGNPTAENIAREIFRVARSKGLPVTRVTLWETDKSFATYQP